MFAPWLKEERQRREQEMQRQKRYRKKNKRVDVKMGHGGTLDPLATGVLIIGVGRGTKTLGSFLECTKSYEATVLFGAATDTYDVLGKVVAKADNSHITREKVQEALEKFRGDQMQTPPIYSAIRIEGKRLYEYARQGLPLPREIEQRPVRVDHLEMVDWMEAGSHRLELPTEIAEKENKDIAEKLLNIIPVDEEPTEKEEHMPAIGEKRKRSREELDKLVIDKRPRNKRKWSDKQNLMSGGLGAEPTEQQTEADTTMPVKTEESSKTPSASTNTEAREEEASNCSAGKSKEPISSSPPGVVLRMTVTSGFYVRSLCHDLGKALGSLGCMATLVRTRQGDFDLGKNVLPFEDLAKGEEVWAPKVGSMLDDWQRSGETPDRELEKDDQADLEAMEVKDEQADGESKEEKADQGNMMEKEEKDSRES
jgi:tRNA pseudouridine55 synthase